MKKTEMIEKIERGGKYVKVKIDKTGEITGMLADEDYSYQPGSNTGGRRFLGDFYDPQIIEYYNN